MTAIDLGRLRWRLLAANLVVAAAGAAAVAAAAWLAAPRAFEAAMGMGPGMMGSGMMGGGAAMMDPAVRAAFGDAVAIALVLGLAAAFVVAVVAATLLSARIARPVSDLAAASGRIARGDYGGRVPPAEGELGELGASFNAMAAALEATDQRRRDLVGDVAHELRTPIASIRGYVEGLETGVFTAGPDAWRVLDDQTARLAHLVDDLALLWQADSRDLRISLEPLDGPTLIADAGERHRSLAAARGITLGPGPSEPATIMADRTRVAQVLDNLVGNALRYTPAGGDVRIGLAVDGRSALLTVKDDGPGLAPGQAERIFDRFYRADPSRSRDAGGSGLGLAISRSLVEAMGGSIVATSGGPGCGTSVEVRLPRA